MWQRVQRHHRWVKTLLSLDTCIFGVMLDDCMTDNLRCIRNYFELSETEAANVSVASELQAMSATSNGFTNDEICVMLEAVCIE